MRTLFLLASFPQGLRLGAGAAIPVDMDGYKKRAFCSEFRNKLAVALEGSSGKRDAILVEGCGGVSRHRCGSMNKRKH